MAKSTVRKPIALITGGSKGLGRALLTALLERDWTVVTDARSPAALDQLVRSHDGRTGELIAISGDVTDADHRAELARRVRSHGTLDLLVNNASTLGETPMPSIAEQAGSNMVDVLAVNLIAPHDLTTLLLAELRAAGGTVLNITSDAAVEGYPGWAAYGVSKAALEQWSNVLAAEEESLSVYWVDPGDLRTDLHQAAFPGEDISDRPLPEVAIPGLLHLIDSRPPSGRYRALELAEGSRT